MFRHFKGLFVTVIAFGLAAAALLILQYYRERLAQAREEHGRELHTIAGVKAAEVAAWRRERIADARVMSTNLELGSFVRRMFTAGGNSGRIELPGWVRQMTSQHDYAAVRLFDTSGKLRYSSAPPDSLLDAEASDFARKALEQRSVFFEDFHRLSNTIHLASFAPLFDGGPDPVGVLEFQIDPARSLYVRLPFWPTLNQSGETLLVRREGSDIVFLNELRHRKNTALQLRIPLTNTTVPAVQAATGHEGVIEGQDYRGVPVLASIRSVPDSPWALVAKIDVSEANATVRSSTRAFAIIAVLVVMLCSCVIFLGWNRRISEQYRQLYQAETERRVLISHFEYLHRYANDIILLMDEAGLIVEANDRAVESYGLAREKLLGLHVRELRTPTARNDFEQQWRTASALDGAVFETMHKRADGSEFPVEVSTRAVLVDGQTFRQSIIRDISERTQSQEALRRSETSLLQAQAMARLGSWEVVAPSAGEGISSEIYVWSDEVYRIFGVDRDTFRPCRELFLAAVHPDDREKVRDAMTRVRSTGRPYEVEHRILRPDSTVRYVREHADCVMDEVGKVSRLIGTVQDLTDYHQLEEQFLQAQKLESLGRLAGGVAHDFNNLLTIINGYSDLVLQKLTGSDPLRKSIVEIQKAGESAAALTRQLLVFSRKQRIQTRQMDLNQVVQDAEKMLQRLVGEDIQLTIRVEPGLTTIVADPTQIQQVIMNLIVNARDAMPHGGAIILETSNVQLSERYQELHCDVQPGAYVILAISDTGIGMDESVKSQIFEPFFTTKPRGVGTGLGLSTVYGIVKQSGGSIWVYSEPGRGTTFKIYFPRAGQVDAAEPEPPRLPRVRGTETILLVEDQHEVRTLAATVLRSDEYTVLEAANAEEALTICRETSRPIHLVLTDVVMPGLSGPELFDKVTQIHSEAKVLFMSGYTEHASLSNILAAAQKAYLEKPFSAATLAMKVREALGAPRPARILVVDDEPHVRHLLRESLTHAGYEVQEAGSVDEALALCKQVGCFDLLISDVRMPGADGHELARRVAQLCSGSRIILTSGFDPGCDECPFEAGCPQISKPFDLQQVVARIAEALTAPPPDRK